MGISGLLQALKSIQVTKHLEEYSGKTIAVDAYVWLHKGIYSCATELATGRRTHKYVDYAMHRVRLLKHYNILPYIVFDGGPLPAKKGTEEERKQKRAENLARGNALAAQGKHSQAREFYVKCVDVTPQMAFQFIKALRAEDVPYVVAPYEADAQLAYLEKVGLADAILTEDSDLLVFGCKNVLFKLDVVANTVVSISRDQFGSVSASASDPNSISLYGWSDTQFRAMAILSGCDYLPSIPGIGLKTANSLLRKWKTVEQVIRAVMMEGKKSVPSGYFKHFQLAEMCFLHQRAYCPLQESLVHLTAVGTNWTEEFDAFVGGNIDPVLAKSIAAGDACPISRLPMTDIHPEFIPRALKRPLSRVSVSPMKSKRAKGKMKETLSHGSILNFFGPNPIIPPRTTTAAMTPAVKPSEVGRASGKRTLAEVMDNDLQQKKKRRKSPSRDPPNKQSKFFSVNSGSGSILWRRHSEGQVGLIAGPSRIRASENKENEAENDIEIMSDTELDGSELSLKAHVDASEVVMNMELDGVEVQQEEGYISPSPSCSRDAQDLSSPVWHDRREQRSRGKGDHMPLSTMDLSEDDERDFNTDILSSPMSAKRPETTIRMVDYGTPTKRLPHGPQTVETILVVPTPTPTKRLYEGVDDIPSPTIYRGPDLRKILTGDGPMKLDLRPESGLPLQSSESTPSPSPSPNSDNSICAVNDAIRETGNMDPRDLDFDCEEREKGDQAASRIQAVMDGWRQRWALPSKKNLEQTSMPETSFLPGSGILRGSNLRRSETTVTPSGRFVAHKAFSKAQNPVSLKTPALRTSVRKGPGLVFVDNTKTLSRTTAMKARKLMDMVDGKPTEDRTRVESTFHPISAQSMPDDEVLSRAQTKLSKYRCS